MEIIVSKQTAKWEHEGNHVTIEERYLHQALFSREHDMVFILHHKEKEPSYISIYELDGNIIREIYEPDNCHFNYLGKNRGHDVAVMAKAYKSGWVDWWYAIEPKNGELNPLGEGR